MNYQKIYFSLINFALKRETVDGYFEKHHIIPKSLGGSDDTTNLVSLTAREHFIAHCLLARIYGGTQWYSVSRMAFQCKKSNSRLYEIAKIKYSEYLSGKERPIEVKEKISSSQKGKKFSESHLKNLKLSNSSENVCQKKRLALLGRKRSIEDINKMKQGWALRRFKKECVSLNDLIDSIFKQVPNGI
jgi:hypothetical protein